MNKQRPSCFLIFPPVWEMAAPFLAGPALVAYLRARGYDVSLFDASNFFWNHFKTKEKASEIYDACNREKNNPSLDIEDGIIANNAAAYEKNEFIKWLIESSIGSPNYELLVRCFGGFRGPTYGGNEDPLRYHDKYFADVSHSYASVHSSKLFDYTYKDTRNPWPTFAKEYILPIIEQRNPDLLGLSIVAPNQVVPAFAIAAESRKAWPGMKILFGGAWVTHLRKRLMAVEWFREKDLLFSPFQGERILEHILDAMGSGGDVNQICGNALAAKAQAHCIRLADLPTPDFSDLNLAAYAEPGNIPLMASKGCYWARCQFCSYPLLEPKYEVRSISNLRNDFLKYTNQYKVKHIPFTDPSLSVPLARRVADIIKQDGFSLTWGAFTRVDAHFTQDVLNHMSENGCTVLHWGLETGSDRIQKDLNKGIDFKVAIKVLSNAAEAGIHSRILMMYGFPQETENDLTASLNLIEELFPNIGSVCWSRCTVELDTQLSERFYQNNFKDGLDLSLGTVADTIYSSDFLIEKEQQMQNIIARLALKNSKHDSNQITNFDYIINKN